MLFLSKNHFASWLCFESSSILLACLLWAWAHMGTDVPYGKDWCRQCSMKYKSKYCRLVFCIVDICAWNMRSIISSLGPSLCRWAFALYVKPCTDNVLYSLYTVSAVVHCSVLVSWLFSLSFPSNYARPLHVLHVHEADFFYFYFNFLYLYIAGQWEMNPRLKVTFQKTNNF